MKHDLPFALTTLRPLLATSARLCLFFALCAGCKSSETDCVVRVVDTDANRPAANKTILFFEDAPLVKAPVPIKADLNTNGEARVHLPAASEWARFDDDAKPYGTSLKPSDIMNGGRFRLYGPPPNFSDTNIYPSKFVLEIRKP
jgi:hypothetical protein